MEGYTASKSNITEYIFTRGYRYFSAAKLEAVVDSVLKSYCLQAIYIWLCAKIQYRYFSIYTTTTIPLLLFIITFYIEFCQLIFCLKSNLPYVTIKENSVYGVFL